MRATCSQPHLLHFDPSSRNLHNSVDSEEGDDLWKSERALAEKKSQPDSQDLLGKAMQQALPPQRTRCMAQGHRFRQQPAKLLSTVSFLLILGDLRQLLQFKTIPALVPTTDARAVWPVECDEEEYLHAVVVLAHAVAVHAWRSDLFRSQ